MIEKYFSWLVNKVYNKKYFSKSYNNLFKKLFSTEFIVIIPLDSNRVSDGLNLRNDFGITIDKPCNILEVLIALVERGERQTMADASVGNRVGQWFWEMIGNMGLGRMSDDNYDEAYTDDILRRFLYHDYDADGRGCAFRSLSHGDLSEYELWYQMQFHFADILEV